MLHSRVLVCAPTFEAISLIPVHTTKANADSTYVESNTSSTLVGFCRVNIGDLGPAWDRSDPSSEMGPTKAEPVLLPCERKYGLN